MLHKISSLVLAIGMWMAFYSSVRDTNDLNFFVLALFLLLLVVTAVNVRRVGFSWSQIALPIIYLTGVGSIFVVIPDYGLRMTFLTGAALVFFWVEDQLGRESHFLQNVYLFSVFAWFVGLFAIHFYLDISTVWLVAVTFILCYLLIAQGFAGFSLPAKKYFHLLIALVCAQAAWGLVYWPTHYLVNAIVLFSLFYLLWIFSFSAFFGKLSIKKIYWQLVLVAVVMLLTLGSAAWEPLYV